MQSPFDAYPVSQKLHCGIYRSGRDVLPNELTSFEADLLGAAPPASLAKFHSPHHLVSFARHLATIVNNPVHRVQVGSHVFHSILGVAVFHCEQDGTYTTALWARPADGQTSWLVEFEPRDTPILDFPRTTLWQSTLRDAFLHEAVERIGDVHAAREWVDWAWAQLQPQLIDSIDLRRLRSTIREQLNLDLGTMSLLRRIRSITGQSVNVPGYNFVRRHLEPLRELHNLSPLMAALAGGLNLSSDWVDSPAKCLKHACTALGIKPQQWKLIAQRNSPLLAAYKSFRLEFAGSGGMPPARDFLQLIAILKPSRGFNPDVWRSILSMCGTRFQPPESYSQVLGKVGKTLAHIVRLVERGASPRSRDQQNAELHLICAWVADTVVRDLTPPQRRLGWSYLVRTAQTYARQREAALALESMRWSIPLAPVTVGGFTAIPLTNGKELWEESIAMRHCADRYGEQCQKGTHILFSVRAADASRYATVGLKCSDGEWEAMQVSGFANKRLGTELDELIVVLVTLMNLLPVPSAQEIPGPHYRVYSTWNWEFDGRWLNGVYNDPEAAVAAAKAVCETTLSSRDLAGYREWERTGETAFITFVGGAPAVNFNSIDYVREFCNIHNISN
jgi:hypothetical protein